MSLSNGVDRDVLLPGQHRRQLANLKKTFGKRLVYFEYTSVQWPTSAKLFLGWFICFNPFSAGADYRRKNLAYLDVYIDFRFWRLKSFPHWKKKIVLPAVGQWGARKKTMVVVGCRWPMGKLPEPR